MAVNPSLPSVLPPAPALQDVTTTPQQVIASVARVTNPAETPIFICALEQCNRLFPSRDRLMAHRRAAHSTDDDRDIITWNE
ncbi:hypothetical protein PHLGIDRAFT_97994 [Phlebiopsis gigantea 11061_1 CR5-6]|uniref:C2H2-type domain-containing protein n=1 Tax=Phlebiopsis gigantea (strain 11061_1 CR5-6) TaxID=745531 RepID=A0A0C3SFS0_PHLG1|nr:hypothetical protein PHLGIDRAFT_97994 [Phlebiopsis gigantea 11061_1 CR5-6]